MTTRGLNLNMTDYLNDIPYHHRFYKYLKTDITALYNYRTANMTSAPSLYPDMMQRGGL